MLLPWYEERLYEAGLHRTSMSRRTERFYLKQLEIEYGGIGSIIESVDNDVPF